MRVTASISALIFTKPFSSPSLLSQPCPLPAFQLQAAGPFPWSPSYEQHSPSSSHTKVPALGDGTDILQIGARPFPEAVS